MAEKKSIIEEALLDIKNIQSALNANTKEILRSVAKEEIDSVVKESINEEIYDEEDMDAPEGETELGSMADAATDGLDSPMGDEESEESVDDELGSLEGSEEVEPEMEPELGMNADALGGDLDMTAASDDDVIAIYKKLSGEDEIEIVGDEIHLNISEPGEYVVKTNDDSLGGADTDTDTEMGIDDIEMGDEGDTEYEIEMGDDDEMEMGGDESEDDAPADLVSVDDEGGEESEEEESEEEVEQLDEKISIGTGMSVGTHRNPNTAGSIGAAENPKSKLDESAKLVSETTKKYNTLLTEAKKLKTENEEFRKTLKLFRTQLVETVVFNSNLTYVTKLFTEHSTTKAEKEIIIQRFDNEVSNLKESKKLYHAIGKELESRKPIAESVQNKIIKEATTGVSKQLTESTAYVDPSTTRILELMKRVEKK